MLCDVSDSVNNVARFMLQFVYALQEEFSGVKSFAFVSDLGDLSDLFRIHELERAIELALSGHVLNVFANSNYGEAFEQFVERHLGLVNRRTNVLIIGDGRNNYYPPREDCLAMVRRQCHRLIWLCPEAPASWGFGDSAMNSYEPHCDSVAVAYNLRSLHQVVSELLETAK